MGPDDEELDKVNLTLDRIIHAADEALLWSRRAS
jgi:hypothetical protein